MKKYLFLIAMSAALLTGCNNDNLETPDQPTDVTEQYDFDKTMDIFEGEYYGDIYGNNGEYNWLTYVSDIGLDEFGYAHPNVTYYMFDIFGPAPEDDSNPLPPAGEYVLGEYDATEEMTFAPDYSEVAMTDAEGALSYNETFIEGSMNISYEGENMVLEVFLTDTQGKTHHVIYNGPAEYFDYSD